MKKYGIFMVLTLIITSFSLLNCTVDNVVVKRNFNLDTLTFEHSMKGWELYSWPNGNDWNYTFLVGTNRLKTYDEIIKNEIIVTGKDSLQLLLDKFPENENIFWISEKWLSKIWKKNYGSLSLPDKKTVNEIKSYCEQKKLILSISE